MMPPVGRRGVLGVFSLGAVGVVARSPISSAMSHHPGSNHPRSGDAELAVATPTPDWINVKDMGAVGDGVTDDTAAIQAVLANLQPTGGCIYFPTSVYSVSALSYNSQKPLYITGDGVDLINQTGGSVLAGRTSATGTHILDIQGSASAVIRDIAVLGAVTGNPSPGADYVGINLNNVYSAHLSGVYTAGQRGGANLNTAVKTNGGVKNFLCYDSTLYAVARSYWMNGSIQAMLQGVNCGCMHGSGFGNIQMDNGAQTIRLTNVQTDQGERGFWMADNGGGDPAFVMMNDVEFNNYTTAGASFDNGHEVWLNQVWCSADGSPAGSNTYGLAFGSSFKGVVKAVDSVFQGNSNHSVLVEGGSGYDFTGCIFGGANKLAANAYDELHIGPAVSYVTCTGNHFNVDPFYGMGSPAARSAIWTGTGAAGVALTNNICAGSGYGDGRGHGGDVSVGSWSNNIGGW